MTDDSALQMTGEALPQRVHALGSTAGSTIMSARATLKTAAKLILTTIAHGVLAAGTALQWQPE